MLLYLYKLLTGMTSNGLVNATLPCHHYVIKSPFTNYVYFISMMYITNEKM